MSLSGAMHQFTTLGERFRGQSYITVTGQYRQCSEVSWKGNRILGMNKITVVNTEKDVIIRLCKALTQLHLEYYI